MGQQQLLLIIVSILLIAFAIAVALSIINAQRVISNRDAIVNDLNDIVANANQFKLRPTNSGGGGGVYNTSRGAANNYDIPAVMKSNANATYFCTVASDKITIVGISGQYTDGTVTVTVNVDGSIPTWSYGEDFK
ncbi:MAG TPA: hypothetical protein VMU30_01895 [Bacteroidota bacterium]|nr:hypothetical protein [Bacteroidota bacterium]